jgi:hypothetical protein
MFSDDDLMGMFSLFDPTSNNFITADQTRTALRNLGIKDLSSVCVPLAPLFSFPFRRDARRSTTAPPPNPARTIPATGPRRVARG